MTKNKEKVTENTNDDPSKKPRIQKSPLEQKAKLLEELNLIKEQLDNFDSKRATKIGNMAKRFKLTDLSDEVLENEFKAIADKYKSKIISHQDEDLKKS